MTFKFSENETITDIETVDSNLRGAYMKTEEGTYALKEDFKELAAAWDGMAEVNAKVRQENKTLTKSAPDLSPLADWGKTPAEVRETFLAKQKELSDALDKRSEVNPEKIRNEMAKTFESEKQELLTRTESLNAQLYETLVTKEATQAIAAEKGNVKLLMPFVANRVKMFEEKDAQGKVKVVARVIDEDGDMVVASTGVPQTVTGLVQAMKKDTDYAQLFEASQKTGGGTPPNGMRTGGSISKAKETRASRIEKGLGLGE